MFGDISIVWDLDSNSEIREYISPHQLSYPETYVTSGINVNLTKKPDQNKELTIVSNDTRTLFIRPKTEDDQLSLFRLFTMLDLAEINDHLQRDSNPDDIDREAILAYLNGKTYFEVLRSKPKILE